MILRRLMTHVRGPSWLAVVLLVASCAGPGDETVGHVGLEGELIWADRPASWFEDHWSGASVSPDGGRAIYGARFGYELIDLRAGERDPRALRGSLDEVHAATFLPDGDLARRGRRGSRVGWFVDGAEGPELTPLPPDALPRWAPGGERVAWVRGPGYGESLFVGDPATPVEVDVEGNVSGFAWSPDGAALYALVFADSGVSSMIRVDPATGETRLVRDGLDTIFRFNPIGVAPDGDSLLVALAGEEPPDPAARHRPDADRDLDIWRLDLETGDLVRVAGGPGDDFAPAVVGEHLYWMHNRTDDAVVVLPAGGGATRVVVEDAQIPYWSHDGGLLAYTHGGWRMADWALNLDAAAVAVDYDARVVGEPRAIVAGWHEDFTPAWSPDGRWIAYHSHRSREPVSFYGGEGSTDDIYVRRPDQPTDAEVRLTDFGWEVGMADWAPDGTRLIFDSWERGGTPGISKPWIATIDPETGRAISIERLPLPEGVESVALAAWSPAGDEIVTVQRSADGRQAIWVLSLDGSAGQRLVEFDSSTYGGIDWTPDGEELVHGALADGRMQLFSVPRAGGEPRRLADEDGNLLHPQVSPDGRWIAATRTRLVKELRRVPLEDALAR